MDLVQLTTGYLQATGHDVRRRARDLLVGTKRSVGQEIETVLVWIPAIDRAGSFRARAIVESCGNSFPGERKRTLPVETKPPR